MYFCFRILKSVLQTIGKYFQARNWEKALELYEYLKSHNLVQTVSTVNALLTALCKFDFFLWSCIDSGSLYSSTK